MPAPDPAQMAARFDQLMTAQTPVQPTTQPTETPQSTPSTEGKVESAPTTAQQAESSSETSAAPQHHAPVPYDRFREVSRKARDAERKLADYEKRLADLERRNSRVEEDEDEDPFDRILGTQPKGRTQKGSEPNRQEPQAPSLFSEQDQDLLVQHMDLFLDRYPKELRREGLQLFADGHDFRAVGQRLDRLRELVTPQRREPPPSPPRQPQTPPPPPKPSLAKMSDDERQRFLDAEFRRRIGA